MKANMTAKNDAKYEFSFLELTKHMINVEFFFFLIM